MADSSAATAAAQKLAEDGLRAIRELERVLLFSDLKDEDAIASNTAAANQALKDLQNVTTNTNTYSTTQSRQDQDEGETKLEQHFDILPPRSDRSEVSNDEHKLKKTDPTSSNSNGSVTSPNMSTTLLLSLSAKWKEFVDGLLLMLESGSQTWKETERKLLFSDLDDIYAKHDTTRTIAGERPTTISYNRSHSTTSTTTTLATPDNRLNATLLLLRIQEQVKVLLKEVELKMSDLQQTTVHAVKECERTLLFTDLPDASPSASSGSYRTNKPNKDVSLLLQQMEQQLKALLTQLELKVSDIQQTTTHAVKECERTLLFTDIADGRSPLRTKQDAVHHFVNSQHVMEELQRKVFFTDCK
jgi:hypothetical protein